MEMTRWRAHEAAGGTLEAFEPGMPLSVNGAWNYFWARGQETAAPDGGAAAPSPQRARSASDR